MPIIVKTDVVDDLAKLANQLRRGVVAPSCYDADFVISPAIDEIRRLRAENGRMQQHLKELNPTGFMGD